MTHADTTDQSDMVPVADDDAAARYRNAQRAARTASTVAFAVVGFAGVWLALMLTAVPRGGPDPAQPETSRGWEAQLAPLVIRSDPSVAVPAVVGFALALLGPFLIAVAAVRIRRALARAPESVAGALMLLAGACAVAVLPGLMIQLEYAVHFEDGGFHRFGGGPAPMCGGLLLIVAAYAGFALLRYGPALRAGPPPGWDG